MKAQERTPADVLEASGVGLLDEEALREWPPKPEEDGEQDGEARRNRERHKAFFLLFTAPWCEVSREAAPRFVELFVKLNDEFPDRAEFHQVDADRAPLASERLNVRSVPAIVAYAHGHEVSRRVGLADRDELTRLAREAIEEAAAGGPPERDEG